MAKLQDFSIEIGKNAEQISYQDLKLFIAALYDLGLSARTQARIISGIKQFYGYLLLENYISIDPSELLDQPKVGRKLPEVLTIEEIDQLIESLNIQNFAIDPILEIILNNMPTESIEDKKIAINKINNILVSNFFNQNLKNKLEQLILLYKK